MLAWFLLGLTAAAPLAEATASAMLGCYVSLPSGGTYANPYYGTDVSGEECRAQCVKFTALGYAGYGLYSYYKRSANPNTDGSYSYNCFCSTTGPSGWFGDASTYVTSLANPATGAVYPNLLECASSAYRVSYITDAYALQACYTTQPSAGMAVHYGQIGDADKCITACNADGDAYPYISFSPSTASCYCAWSMGSAGGVKDSICHAASAYIYAASSIPAASVVVRRRERQMARQAQVVVHGDYCPNSAGEACVLPGGEGYECLNTQTELESCGGCVRGVWGNATALASGVDCTAIASARFGAVTCHGGECVVTECEDGFVLVEGACVARRQ